MAKRKLKILKYFSHSKCKKITWLDYIAPIETFKTSKIYEAYEPNYYCKIKFTVTVPDINLYKFSNAKINVESSHIILNETVVMERLPIIPVEYCNYSTGIIEVHNKFYAVYNASYSELEIDKAFFVGGNGSWNYYHWTIEIISKLKYFLSKKNIDKDIKIIFPIHAKNIESFSTMVEILLSNKFETYYIDNSKIIKVRELYIVTTPSNVVYNTKYGKEFENNFLFFDKESINYVRNSILNSQQYNNFLNSSNKKQKFLKVYLARKKHTVRGYNHEKVLEVAIRHGFQPIYLEELSFFNQVYLFQNVKYIIGASGAAWTNIIFMRKGVRGLSWLGENIKSFSCYSTLAEYYGCDLQFLSYKVAYKEEIHSDYSLDLEVLDEKISRLIG